MTPKGWKRGLVTAGALLLGLAVATSSWAQATVQGLYYREFKKDNRYFVFNNAKAAEAFEKTGETGVGLTRVGVGPNGESVFADNETALELFFFKHGISQEVERPKSPVQRIEWRDGKTRMTLGSNFYLEMSNRIQPRFTFQLPDDSVQLPGTAAKGDSKGSFRIRRAKFKLEGWFYKPTLEFELQLNWPDVTGTPASRFLEDANIDWALSDKRAFRVKFGQFKAPYGRQQLTSSGAQQFVDRADTDARYNPGRETGLALWGTLGTNKLDWRAMISNGNGRSQELNDNDKYLYSARVMWQAVGNTRMNQWASGALMTEGDLGDSAQGALLAIAGNWLNNNFHNATTGIDQKFNQYGGDYSFKYKGFASVGEYHFRKSEPEPPAAGGTPALEFEDKGWLVQASYAFKAPGIVPGGGFFELAFRYSQIDPTDLVVNNDRTEIAGAVSYYLNRHNLKVQADFREIEDEAANSGAGTKTKEFRLQTQFIF